jgi:hypothetical protein
METFKKRQKEMKRLERQRDKAAKRLEIKARKASGIISSPDAEISTADNPPASDPSAGPSTVD